MGGGKVPQPRSAFQDYRDTTNWLATKGASKSYRLAETWDPRFTEIGLRDSATNAQNASRLTNQMLAQNEGMTPEQDALMRQYFADNGVGLSDAAYSRMTAPIASDMTQQRMANLQGLYPLIPKGAFTPMNSGAIFGAQRQTSAFNQALGSQAAAQQAAMNRGLTKAGFGAVGTGVGYWGENTNWGRGNGTQTYNQAFGNTYVGDINTSSTPFGYPSGTMIS